MTYIGDEVTEVLAKQPSRLFVIRIIRKKYAREGGEGVVIGRMPSRAIEKGLAHESLLADILVSKYVDHLPLYRQAKILAREKVNIASSTMSDWVAASCRLLEPLYEALKKEYFSTSISRQTNRLSKSSTGIRRRAPIADTSGCTMR